MGFERDVRRNRPIRSAEGAADVDVLRDFSARSQKLAADFWSKTILTKAVGVVEGSQLGRRSNGIARINSLPAR